MLFIIFCASLKITGIDATKSLIWLAILGITSNVKKYKNNISKKYTSIIAGILLIPLVVNLLTKGFNNHAITKPIKNGLKSFKRLNNIGTIFHSFKINTIIYIATTISKKYKIFKTLLVILKISFNFFIFKSSSFFFNFSIQLPPYSNYL